jgi:hypothetical protein
MPTERANSESEISDEAGFIDWSGWTVTADEDLRSGYLA